MKRAKISIIGGGNVGAACAQGAIAKQLAEVVLVDVVAGLAQGKALDLRQAAAIDGLDAHIVGTNAYNEAAGSDLAIITAGHALKHGMHRDQLLEVNVGIVADATHKLVERSPDAILLVVTNPLDAMVYTAWKVSGFPPQRVLGQAGVLDTTRFRRLIADEVGCSVRDVSALLIGGHATDLVPLTRCTTVGGTPVSQLIPPGKLEEIIECTRNGGAEIVSLLKTSGSYYAAAAAAITMATSIIRDQKRLLPCAAYCNREYGVGGCFVGVPAVLGRSGVERVVEIMLDKEERERFQRSVEHVKALCARADRLLSRWHRVAKAK
jgi:malate dehydrogenase